MKLVNIRIGGAHSGRRSTFWAAAGFYALVTFEFCYMAGPFAGYFYAAYGPGLNFIDSSPPLAWLTRVFLPHIAVQTANPILDLHNVAGLVLAAVGFAGFVAGACQVYASKLLRRGAVLGGVYRRVRHPQYVSLAVCGAGMLLLWPRYLVLLAFVSILFAYYLLARLEERECAAKYGQPYLDYQRRTRMFLPFGVPVPGRVRHRVLRRWRSWWRRWQPRGRVARVAFGMACYALAVAGAVAVAAGVNRVAVDALYLRCTAESVYLSVSRIDAGRLAELVRVAEADPEVRAALDAGGQTARYLTYVLPADWDISETLMTPVPGGAAHHLIGGAYHGQRYRMVFTRARLSRPARGRDILLHTVARTPLLEIVVDLGEDRVVEVLPPNQAGRYAGIPVPVY